MSQVSPRRQAAFSLRVVACAALLVAGGCPSDPEPPPPCAGDGDPAVSLASRSGEALTDGSEVEVFPPPQGGVFTELDLTIDNLPANDVLFVRVDIAPRAGGDALAAVRYFGEAIPLICTDQEQLEVDNLPVGFNGSVQLSDTDGVLARVTVTVETEAGVFDQAYDVTLRVTDF